MRPFNSAALLAGALLVIGAAPVAAHSRAHKAWWKERDKHPATFVVSAEAAEVAWARSLECVATFYPSDITPISVANDTLIQTDRPFDVSLQSVVFTVVRTKIEDGAFRMTFSATSPNVLNSGLAKRLAKSCAYYSDIGVPEPKD